MKPMIRPMAEADIAGVTRLSAQLGYPAAAEAVAENFQLIRSDPFQEVFVAIATGGSEVIGWLHVYRHLSIATGPRCEIGGVVVDEELRGNGIGTFLMTHAEAWAKSHNMKFVRFSSKVSRTEAHRLYERLGYQVQKTSHIFNKAL